MKGNYQDEAPMMKLSPETAEKSRVYKIQQYIRKTVDKQVNFILAPGTAAVAK